MKNQNENNQSQLTVTNSQPTVIRNGTYYKTENKPNPGSVKAQKYLPFALWGFGLLFTLLNSFVRPSLTLNWGSAIILFAAALLLTLPIILIERKVGIKKAYLIGFSVCHVVAFLLPFVIGAACETVYMWFTAIGGVFLYEVNYRMLPAKKRPRSLTKLCMILFGVTSVAVMVVMAFIMPLSGGVRYAKNADGNYYVIAASNVHTVKVADTIRGKAVTGVRSYSFSKNVFTKEVVLPTSITKMEYLSFSGMTNVEALTISPAAMPEGMMYTLWYSSSDVPSVANTLVPESITKITVIGSVTDNCFGLLTNLKEVEFIGNVKKIGSNGFAGCTSLEKIALPEGVTIIDTYAFSYCRALSDITLPETLKTINAFAFQYNTSLREIVIPKNVTTVQAFIFDCCATGLLSIEVKCTREETSNWDAYWLYKVTEYDDDGNPTNYSQQAFKKVTYAVNEPVTE